VRGGISRKAFGIGGGSPQDYVVEAGKSLRRRAMEEQRAAKNAEALEKKEGEEAEIRQGQIRVDREKVEEIEKQKRRRATQPQK
jgi:hypothetical protein